MDLIKVIKNIILFCQLLISIIKIIITMQTQNEIAGQNATAGQSIRNILSQRRCSYCRAQGHNVSTCNNPTLLEVELLFLEKKFLFRSHGIDSSKNLFTSWLLEIVSRVNSSSHLIKSYAIRKCNARSRDDILICIRKIVHYIYREEDPSLDYIPFDSHVALLNNMYTNLYMNRTLNYMNQMDTNNYSFKKIIEFNYIECKDEAELSIETECSICYELKEERDYIKIDCGHKFCVNCSLSLVKSKNVPCCALCRKNITKFECKDECVKKTLLDSGNASIINN